MGKRIRTKEGSQAVKGTGERELQPRGDDVVSSSADGPPDPGVPLQSKASPEFFANSALRYSTATPGTFLSSAPKVLASAPQGLTSAPKGLAPAPEFLTSGPKGLASAPKSLASAPPLAPALPSPPPSPKRPAIDALGPLPTQTVPPSLAQNAAQPPPPPSPKGTAIDVLGPLPTQTVPQLLAQNNPQPPTHSAPSLAAHITAASQTQIPLPLPVYAAPLPPNYISLPPPTQPAPLPPVPPAHGALQLSMLETGVYQLLEFHRRDRGAWEQLVGWYIQETGRLPTQAIACGWKRDCRKIDILEKNINAFEIWSPPGRDTVGATIWGQLTGSGHLMYIFEEAIRRWANGHETELEQVLKKACFTSSIWIDDWMKMGNMKRMDEGPDRERLLALAKEESPRFYDQCMNDVFCGWSKTRKREDGEDVDVEVGHGTNGQRETALPPAKRQKIKLDPADAQPTQIHAVPLEERHDRPSKHWRKNPPPEEKGPFGNPSTRHRSSRTTAGKMAKKEKPTVDEYGIALERERQEAAAEARLKFRASVCKARKQPSNRPPAIDDSRNNGQAANREPLRLPSTQNPLSFSSTVLRPAHESFLPARPTWVEATIARLIAAGWLPGDMIGHRMPVLENGDFDWDHASLYWKAFYWIDSRFGSDFCGMRDED